MLNDYIHNMVGEDLTRGEYALRINIKALISELIGDSSPAAMNQIGRIVDCLFKTTRIDKKGNPVWDNSGVIILAAKEKIFSILANN